MNGEFQNFPIFGVKFLFSKLKKIRKISHVWQLRVRKAEPVERSKMRISVVQAVTSHVRFQNGKIEK